MLAGVTTKVKVAHLRLCHSRMFIIVRAIRARAREWVRRPYPRLRLPGRRMPAWHLRQHEHGGGTRSSRAATGQYNRRFLHSAAITSLSRRPARRRPVGEGQVENQVGNVRERFFTPTLRFKSYSELNSWLADRCIVQAKTTMHPEFRERTVWDVYQDEKLSLMQLAGGAVRRLSMRAGGRLEDAARALRPQQVLGGCQGCWPARRGSRLRRPDRHPPGGGDRWRAPAPLRPRRRRL